jgi:hypothetical protein
MGKQRYRYFKTNDSDAVNQYEEKLANFFANGIPILQLQQLAE